MPNTADPMSHLPTLSGDKNTEKISGLAYNLDQLGLQVSKDVKNDGNCWFHSMTHLGYGKSARELRVGLANLMLILGDKKGLFPNQPDTSLRDMFSFTNEIGNVYNNATCFISAYNYEAMCQDIRLSGSWRRLPMNLIMQLVSLLYDLEFIVVPNRKKQTPLRVVWTEDHTFQNRVYLAKMDEIHYMPLEKIPGWSGPALGSIVQSSEQLALNDIGIEQMVDELNMTEKAPMNV